MIDSYEILREAIRAAESAKACIAQNRRGYDKELARDGYLEVLLETLSPAIAGVMGRALEDISDDDVLRLAKTIEKMLEKAGAL